MKPGRGNQSRTAGDQDWIMPIFLPTGGKNRIFKGTSFFLASGLLLTCKHVFAAGDRDLETFVTGDPEITGLDATARRAIIGIGAGLAVQEVIFAPRGIDLALLRIVKPPEMNPPPILSAINAGHTRSIAEVRAIGFAEQGGKPLLLDFPLALTNAPADGSTKLLFGLQFQGGPWEGMSGSPIVITRDGREYLLGILTHGGKGRATSLAASSDEIIRFCQGAIPDAGIPAVSAADVFGTGGGPDDCVRAYCARIRSSSETMYLFGRAAGQGPDNAVASTAMTRIEHGFIPLQLAAENAAAEAAPIELSELFPEPDHGKRILVKGLPGSGKSTLLRYLAFSLASRRLDGKGRFIPVYLRLRDCLRTTADLETAVKRQIDAPCSSVQITDKLMSKEFFLETPMVLLLDGADEIEDPKTNAAFPGLLDALALDHPRCTIVVSSRHKRLDAGAYSQFRFLDLLPLTPEKIGEYVDRWFESDATAAGRVRGILDTRPRIAELAGNPFLLSMICFVFAREGDGAFIERRSQLYESCTRYLLERPWDAKPAGRGRVDFDAISMALQDVSLRFFLWQEACFDIEHVNVMEKRVFPAGVANAPNGATGPLGGILDSVAESTGMIQRTGEGFVFVHRSLWEYFTARALLKKDPDFVARHAGNPDWEEVVRLYAGLLAPEKVEALVRGLWNVNRPLALRVTTEVKVPAATLIKPLIAAQEGNAARLLLIDGLEQSLPLIPEWQRPALVRETLRILLIDCEEKDCEVMYHAQELLERAGLPSVGQGGLIYEYLDLAHARDRQERMLADPANHFEWIEIEGGSFMMGDDAGEDDERPAHEVSLDGFALAKHPVTNRMLSSFPLGSKYPNYGGDSHPAVGNTWYEAYYFALWLGCRLPAEAQWEYAARGGTQSQYFVGDDEEMLADHAWFGETKRKFAHAVDEVNSRTGEENLNPFGLANITGNVWEWCADWYGRYSEQPVQNPPGPEKGSSRVLRGGSWNDFGRDLRSAFRDGIDPSYA